MADEKASQRRVEPRLSPQLAELREQLRAGTHHGKPFVVTVTNRQLEDAIAWYVERRPRMPFRNPKVLIDPAGLGVQGEAHLGTLELPLSAQADVLPHDGLPVIAIERLETQDYQASPSSRFRLN